MTDGAQRRGMAVFLLTAGLLVPGLDPATGLAGLWDRLAGLISVPAGSRWLIDPNGGSGAEGDDGGQIDPDGGDSTVDNRWLIDPNG